MRYTTRLFPCRDLEQFQRAIEKAAVKLGCTFDPKKTSANGANTLIVERGSKGISVDGSLVVSMADFLREVSWALEGLPYLEARIQEGSHWDYSLMRGLQHLDKFSTYPQYWEGVEDPIEILYNRGCPEMLSLVFEVSVGKIDRYMRHWYSDWDPVIEDYRTKLEGKAYPNDQYPYRNYEQLFDFVKALGFYDLDDPSRQRFEWTLELSNTGRATPPKRKTRNPFWKRRG